LDHTFKMEVVTQIWHAREAQMKDSLEGCTERNFVKVEDNKL